MDNNKFLDITCLANESSSWESSLMIEGVNICPFLYSKSIYNFKRGELVNLFLVIKSALKYNGKSSDVDQIIKRILHYLLLHTGLNSY